MTVEDLSSHDGTSVNGRVIDRPTTLRDGDTLQIGRGIFKSRRPRHLESAMLDYLFHRSTRDPLTGAWNRHYGEVRLREEFAAAVELQAELAIVFIDLDEFKPVNDLHGHAAGDAILMQTAELFEELIAQDADGKGLSGLGADGCFGRQGGDEFMAVLPGMGGAEAKRWAQRACEVYAATAFRCPGIEGDTLHERHATVSMGVAWLDGTVRDLNAFIEAADKCCLASKKKGRNRVTAIDEARGHETA